MADTHHALSVHWVFHGGLIIFMCSVERLSKEKVLLRVSNRH